MNEEWSSAERTSHSATESVTEQRRHKPDHSLLSHPTRRLTTVTCSSSCLSPGLRQVTAQVDPPWGPPPPSNMWKIISRRSGGLCEPRRQFVSPFLRRFAKVNYSKHPIREQVDQIWTPVTGDQSPLWNANMNKHNCRLNYSCCRCVFFFFFFITCSHRRTETRLQPIRGGGLHQQGAPDKVYFCSIEK